MLIPLLAVLVWDVEGVTLSWPSLDDAIQKNALTLLAKGSNRSVGWLSTAASDGSYGLYLEVNGQ